ncbi:hypothetical protein AWB67_02273 [Caballeronia terrestris]|uniref:Serine protease n=1 Tax=Caballeronia terrestris TaxID=1226301 RepID=A0A158HZM4_9BURK|nr:serine protease [Caballeronia terrestris]SAL49792.1 hypothetical protein AWB67_02273 [Caballeronia terrestris]
MTKGSSIWGFAAVCALSCSTLTRAQSIEQTVVYIECKSDKASTVKGAGVLVSPYGHVLTAKHVAPAGYVCKGVIGTGAQQPTRNLIRDPRTVNLDAVLLRFVPAPDEKFSYLRYRRLEGSNLKGAAITVSGFPPNGTGEIVTNSGTLSSLISDETGIVKTDALSASGMSGGPVILKSDGSLIGIVAGAQFDPATGSPSSYGVLSMEWFANEFGLTSVSPETAVASVPASSPKIIVKENEYGPIEFAPGESKSFPLDLGNAGAVDVFMQSIVYEGADHGAQGVFVRICSAQNNQPCDGRQIGESETFRQRLTEGPGQISIFNFKENPKIKLTFRIASPA